MVLSPSKCVVLSPLDDGDHRPPLYFVEGNALPVVNSVRDLGVTVSSDPNFGEHVALLTSATFRLVNCIFRCFVVQTPAFYLKLYEALVLSRFQFCGPIWLPHKVKHINSLEAIQRLFLRRLHLRCHLSPGTMKLPPVHRVLSGQDAKMLAQLIEFQLAEHFFEIRENNLRSGRKERFGSLCALAVWTP